METRSSEAENDDLRIDRHVSRQDLLQSPQKTCPYHPPRRSNTQGPPMSPFFFRHKPAGFFPLQPLPIPFTWAFT